LVNIKIDTLHSFPPAGRSRQLITTTTSELVPSV